MKALPLLVSILLCSGCASGLLENKQPVQQTYAISPAPASTQASALEPPLPVALTVTRPLVRPGLDSDRIAVLYPDRRLDYYSGGRWGAAADIIVQSLLVESLRNTAKVNSVHSDLASFAADYLLHTELRDFQAEYNDGAAMPVVHVTLVCTLGRVHGRHPLASYSATAAVPAGDNSLRAVVAAFESAYGQAAQSVVANTLAALTAALSQPAGETSPAPP